MRRDDISGLHEHEVELEDFFVWLGLYAVEKFDDESVGSHDLGFYHWLGELELASDLLQMRLDLRCRIDFIFSGKRGRNVNTMILRMRTWKRNISSFF